MAASHDKKSGERVATNRKALHDYFVLDRIEAGLELRGTEVKSVRSGNVNLTGGFVKVEQGRMVLHGVHIAPYECGNRHNHDPLRPRQLLLHRREISRLDGKLATKGLTLIPLSMFFGRRWAKVELGVCKGKQDSDKRETMRRKEADREAQRAIERVRS
jgi:SsrA-binding protein